MKKNAPPVKKSPMPKKAEKKAYEEGAKKGAPNVTNKKSRMK